MKKIDESEGGKNDKLICEVIRRREKGGGEED